MEQKRDAGNRGTKNIKDVHASHAHRIIEAIEKEEIEEKENRKRREVRIITDVKDKMEKERTMALSIKEGSATSVMGAMGETYITPFALALNANNAQIGFLSSFSGLFGPLSQLFGSKIMEKFSRRSIIAKSVALQAFMWLPILLLGLLFWKNLFASSLPVILIIFYTIYIAAGSISGPAWFSLLGDIIPEKIRGRYFSKRNRICGSVALVMTLVAAFILDFFKTKGLVLIGFSILFIFAFIFRLISARLFAKHYEPAFKLEKGYYFTLLQFVRKMPGNNFGRFVMYVALTHFATSIAGPFFAVYMLKDLQFSYIWFTLINLSASIFSLAVMPVLGKLSDKYGNKKLLAAGGVLVPIMPVLWLFSSNPIYLMIVPQLAGGIGWAAFNFAAGNFIYDSVTPQRRGLCVSYFNVLIGIGTFIGAAIGGMLAQNLSITFMNKLLFIFFLSGCLRAVVGIIMLPKIGEVRKVKKARVSTLLVNLINPINIIFNNLILIASTTEKAGKKLVDGIKKTAGGMGI